MNKVCKDIFQSIHEGCWLSIEYKNKDQNITNYWIAIKSINVPKGMLIVDGFHLVRHTLQELYIYMDSILSSAVIEGSYYKINRKLVEDIRYEPEKYRTIFSHSSNLKILNYLLDCSRLDTTPYKTDYGLIRYLDGHSFRQGVYQLTDEQFAQIIRDFQRKSERERRGEGQQSQGLGEHASDNGIGKGDMTHGEPGEQPRPGEAVGGNTTSGGPGPAAGRSGGLKIQQLAMNVLSIHTRQGLYVLAYRKLRLDVRARCLTPAEEITVCREFTVDGERMSIRKFLEAEDYELLDNFEANQELIKDRITAGRQTLKEKSVSHSTARKKVAEAALQPAEIQAQAAAAPQTAAEQAQATAHPQPAVPQAQAAAPPDYPASRSLRPTYAVDDMPYLIAIEGRIQVDLNREYKAILDMYDRNETSYPIKAFFGDLLGRPDRRKEYPIALVNNKVNLDQLLAIHNAMKYPLAYVQGPPGTGKTNTIVNTIATAFFNGRTVLFVSYNNHPIDGVVDAMTGLKYQGQKIPFPILRLGSKERDGEAIEYIKALYEDTKKIKIFSNTLEKHKGNRIEQTRKLTALLKRHEEFLDLTERRETLEKLIQSNHQLTFTAELQGRQLYEVKERLKAIGRVTDEEALSVLSGDAEELAKYLFYTSANYVKRLDEPKNEKLLKIIYMEDRELRLEEFEAYLKNGENLKKLQRIFPVIATTCISAHKLGEPKPSFDMVIMDEASQCNLAVGLIPVIRGDSLLLVGDPQQLKPVILLDPKDNQLLRKNYCVAKEYDYLDNSIYKTYLSSDSVSDEVLLSYHYRCDKKIIEFNNRKYYNSKLNIMTKSLQEEPLVYMEMGENRAMGKNTAPAEAQAILEYVAKHREKKIGIITPFVNQKEYIQGILKERGITDVTCGTVHAFQGDEKDVILFSMALTDQSGRGTYQWLKNNKELINVATSRARQQLVILGSEKNMERLREPEERDDLYELVEYARSKGVSKVTPKTVASRALGVKPYSSETEEAFLANLNHALDNILYGGRRCVIHREVGISHVFEDSKVNPDLFYSGRFDFVVYERTRDRREIPILAIELDGREHEEDLVVQVRNKKKQEICREHGLELIRIENTYARRYYHVKDILIRYFEKLYKI